MVNVWMLLERVSAPRDLFEMSFDEAFALVDLETKSLIGRPMGNETSIAGLERKLGRSLAPQKRGPKGKTVAN